MKTRDDYLEDLIAEMPALDASMIRAVLAKIAIKDIPPPDSIDPNSDSLYAELRNEGKRHTDALALLVARALFVVASRRACDQAVEFLADAIVVPASECDAPAGREMELTQLIESGRIVAGVVLRDEPRKIIVGVGSMEDARRLLRLTQDPELNLRTRRGDAPVDGFEAEARTMVEKVAQRFMPRSVLS